MKTNIKYNNLVKLGQLYEDSISHSEKIVKKISLKNIPKEIKHARKILKSIVSYLLLCKIGQKGKTSKSISERISLSQIFNQGLFVTEEAIIIGQYYKACCCLKQEIEILTRIRELRKKIKSKKKKPNIKNSPIQVPIIYGIMNEISHISKPEYLKQLLSHHRFKNSEGVGANPIFNTYFGPKLIEFNTVILFEMVLEQLFLHQEIYSAHEECDLIINKFFPKIMQKLNNAGCKFVVSENF